MEAIILCGGQAKRMKPYVPFNKALADIQPGLTLLEHQITWLTKTGISRILLAIDHESYEALQARGLRVEDVDYSIETERLGTGGAVFKAIERVESSSVYVMNVDDLILSATYQPSQLLTTLHNTQASGSILVTTTNFPFGVVESESNRVTGFLEKPRLDFKINAGHYAFTTDGVRNYFPKYGNFEDTALPAMAHDQGLYAKELDGEWITINNVKQLEAARQRLQRRVTNVTAVRNVRPSMTE